MTVALWKGRKGATRITRLEAEEDHGNVQTKEGRKLLDKTIVTSTLSTLQQLSLSH